jgi:hypothetical protein
MFSFDSASVPLGPILLKKETPFEGDHILSSKKKKKKKKKGAN